MNAWLAWPLVARAAVVCLVGLGLGGLVNWAVFGLAWNRRPHSPWAADHPRDAAASWLDRLPLVGWLRLRRKASQLGRGFWVRPLLVELLTAGLLVGLYLWHVDRAGIVPLWPEGAVPGAALGPALHGWFAFHGLLLVLMLAASWIDIDEQTIPDAITIPGTLAALAAVAIWPWLLLPAGFAGQGWLTTVDAVYPEPWPAVLAAAPEPRGLALALAIYLAWWAALLPRPWRGRHGPRRAVELLVARAARAARRPGFLALAAVGLAGIVAAWWRGGPGWQGLVTSLVGLAAGGAVVWLTRLIGFWALGREAMGFGDVTLLAMIGAFLGWQAVLVVFFLAPFAGLVLGIAQWLVRREHALPYGPFLCLATAWVVVRWYAIWPWAEPLFSQPGLVPLVVLACFSLLGVTLGLWRLVRGG